MEGQRRKIMNRVQKIAWMIVITISLAVVLSAVAAGILYEKFGLPKAAEGLAFLGIAGIGGLGPLIFKKDKGHITCDERDRIINHKATLAGWGAAYLIVGLSCMLPFLILGPNSTISVYWLPMIFTGAALSSFFMHSVAILILYGREVKGEKL
jgi:hypothetical protein